MNVIFLDFDGVLNTCFYESDNQIEQKIIILAVICHRLNAKVVVISNHKNAFDDNMEPLKDIITDDDAWILNIIKLFKKYHIEVLGKTKDITRYFSNDKSIYIDNYRDDEIVDYLNNHLNIKHICIIDDYIASDLINFKDYIVQPKMLDTINPQSEGLQLSHLKEVEKILKMPININNLCK